MKNSLSPLVPRADDADGQADDVVYRLIASVISIKSKVGAAKATMARSCGSRSRPTRAAKGKAQHIDRDLGNRDAIDAEIGVEHSESDDQGGQPQTGSSMPWN